MAITSWSSCKGTLLQQELPCNVVVAEYPRRVPSRLLQLVGDKTGVKKLRVCVTQCPPSIQTNMMSRNKEHDLDQS